MSARPPAKSATKLFTSAGANAHGQCRARSPPAPRRDSSGFFETRSAAVTFTKVDIAFVYGSRWKQRYFTKVGDDYFPLPAQWDVTHKMWRRYFVPNDADWWAPLYPPDNSSGRPARSATVATQ